MDSFSSVEVSLSRNRNNKVSFIDLSIFLFFIKLIQGIEVLPLQEAEKMNAVGEIDLSN